MDEIFNSDLAQSTREKVDSNLRMVDRIAPTSGEPTDALLIAMNGVMRTLATGQMSFENTRISLSVLLHQLQAKISEDSANSCHAVSLITFTKIFAIGMEKVLPLLLSRDQQDATDVEGMDEIFNSDMIKKLRETIHSNIQMIGRVTLTSEEPIDSLLLPMVDVFRTLTSGSLSREITRPSLFFLLLQLHSKISVDYANSSFAVSLVSFTKVFFVGMERVLPLLPKEEVEHPARKNAAKRILPEEREPSPTPIVKEEDEDVKDNPPPVDTSHASHGDITGAKETRPEDSASNPPPPPLKQVSQQHEQNDEATGEAIKLEEPEGEHENNEADTIPAVQFGSSKVAPVAETINMENPEELAKNNEANMMPENESLDRAEESDANSEISSSYLDLHPLSSLESEDSGSSPGREWVSDSEEEPTKETAEHFGNCAKLTTDQELKDPPNVPEHIVPEERVTLTTPIVENEEKLLSLVPENTPPQVDVSHVSNEDAGEDAPTTDSAHNSQPPLQMPPQQSQTQTQPAEGAPEMEKPEEENGKVDGGGQKKLNQDNFINNFNDGLGDQLDVSPPLTSASSDIRTEFRRRLKSFCSQLEPTEFSLDSLWDDQTSSQDGGGEGEAQTGKEDGEDETEPVESLELTLRTRSTKQKLAGMTDSEIMELDESDSSSGSDSGSEYEEPTAKKRAKLSVDYDESPTRKKSKRARRQTLQQQKNRPLKSKAGKTLPKRSRRDSKEGVGEDTEAAEDVEVDTTSGKTGDKRKCQLCGAKPNNPSEHIAFCHLKKHLFTCPVCDGYGSGKSCDVVEHIKKKHPSDAGKQPVSHVVEHSTEMQRLQAICFPNLVLKVSRPPKNTCSRSTCMLCNEKVDDSNRQCHVFSKHFKNAGLFGCPLCDTSRPTFDTVRLHIRRHHQKDFGKVQPISHEKDYEKEITALNQQCFPGWKRISSYGKKKRAAQNEDSEPDEKSAAAEKVESEPEEKMEWKRAPTMSARRAETSKARSMRRKT